MRTLLFLSLSLSLVACGDDDGDRPRDSGTGVDTGMPIVPDGGGTDTGTGPGVDGGPDAGEVPADCNAGGTCNLLVNNCPTAGEACYSGMDGPTCFAAGTRSAGEACMNLNDCREGLGCLGTEEGGFVCRQLCCMASGGTECATGELCLGFTGADGDIGFCEAPSGCDVINQTGCPDGEDCALLSGDGSTTCTTLPDDGGTQGASCTDDPCAAGFLCLRVMDATDAFCLRACNPAMDMCVDGFTCARLTDSLGGCTPEG
ncbi:MAG: hypothetical protein MUE69_09675 [Myxococcota bacterium]|jgi:hypothetical protein|nr:hypothetical protein [Myxococcota bacterium]